ncbi:GAF domain-containing sensor histidine kinase [Halovivax gelatinilyticus]|uniref:sensor histidine kinase n=1 Tax=Halovivax gelatinilyticus TaxID=2961597 RepID=UPI0020CA74BA|nr:GAF domain-containing sensor histidine kinase [Halovivax gelatinilyticus]
MRVTDPTDIERLNQAATHFYTASSTQACYDEVIDAAVEILGHEWSVLASPVGDGERFEIKAVSAEAPLDRGDRPFTIHDGVAGRAFRQNESSTVDDVRESEHGKPVTPDLRSGLTVPVGDWGVFQAVDTTIGAYDETHVRLAELLMTHAATAIERLETEAALRTQKAELERQNERLDNVTSMISHDLRSPLNVAQGHLELARAEADSPHLADVAAAHERMDDLIEEFLAWARGGQLITDRTTVSLPEVARAAAESLSVGQCLVVDTETRIEADPDRLRQLCTNVIRNSVEHNGGRVHVGDRKTATPSGADGGPFPEGAPVTVTLGDHPDGFVITDDGSGIPPTERESVFEPGYTTSDSGTGFGLAIVGAIVDAHGWEVSLGESDDGGVRFEITGVERIE